MSSERAGTPTHGHLDRERVIYLLWEAYDAVPKGLLDALGACVVPDPRITRVEALLDQVEAHAGDLTKDIWPDRTVHNPKVYVEQVRAILRGDQ